MTGTTDESSTYPYSRITDGNLTTSYWASASSSSENQCIIVDLEETYDLDEVAVWNYFGDQRSYYDNMTYVSSDNSTWTEVIDDASIETSNGHRINAYNDTYNGYVSDGLVLWYDGYANTGKSRSCTSTTWKNLANSSYSGSLTGGTWYGNYLYFDGTDDFVNTTYSPSYDKYTLEAIVYPELTSSSDQEIFNSHNGSGIGLAYNNNHFLSIVYSGSYISLSSNNQYAINNMYHVVVTYDGSDILLYINGTLENKQTNVGTITSGSVPIFIGANPNSSGSAADSGYFLKGRIYNAIIYQKNLTSDEILHNYLYDKQKFNLE